MKKISCILFFCAITLSLCAQDIITAFMGKCPDKEKLEIVTIGKKMLDVLGTMATQDKELSETLNNLESIRVVTSSDSTLNAECYNAAYQLLTKKSQGFEELLSVKENDENMLILVKENKGIIKELVFLSGGGDKQSFNLISLNGKIDLAMLSKYSKELNIKALDKINSTSSK